MNDRPEAQPGILEIALYQSGAASAPGVAQPVKLSANENPYGPSPKAIAAFAAAGTTLNRYPQTDHAPLRAAIGRVHDLDPARIVCGVGSDEIFNFIAYAYAGPGDEILHTQHGFSMYPIVARAASAVPVQVPERDRVVDVDAILAAVTPRTRVIFVANPGNPTGTMLPEAALQRLAEEVPRDVVLVLDGAYAEFAPGYDGGASLVHDSSNIVMTRTFSKAYGLGGLRVGWGYGPQEIIDTLNRVRPPFNLGDMQLATALSAVEDQAHTLEYVARNGELRAGMTADLRALGIAVDESFANFILARFADAAQAQGAQEALLRAGYLVRPVVGYGFPEALRITIGTPEDCAGVTRALKLFMEGK